MTWARSVPRGHILHSTGGVAVSIQYLQAMYLHSSLPSSAELIHRTRKQSGFLLGDVTIHHVSCINQVAKTCSTSERQTEHLF